LIVKIGNVALDVAKGVFITQPSDSGVRFRTLSPK
jgi:hypothetical protein